METHKPGLAPANSTEVCATDAPKGTPVSQAPKKKLGGARPGAGRPKGPRTIKKIAIEKAAQQMSELIASKSADLVRAGLIPAMGARYVYRIDRVTGERGGVIETHVQLTDPHEIAKALDAISVGGKSEDGTFYYVTVEKPDHKAIEMLLNRGHGKPKESVAVEHTHKFSLTELAKDRDKLLLPSGKSAKRSATLAIEPPPVAAQ